MPVEAKPLFRPDVLRAHLTGFASPGAAAVGPKLAQWSDLIRSAKVDSLNERELLPDFLTDLFVHLLGYEGPPGRDGLYTLSREQHVEVEGQFADAALGRFSAGRLAEFIVAVEGKGPKDPLERPHGGRRMSAVDQGYKYAVNLPCDWIVVTNIRQTRLYYKGANQQTYERFDTERLATDPAHLAKLVFLLGAERVLPRGGGRCHLYDLLSASERAGRELTKEFYRAYADLREEAFDGIAAANPTVERPAALTATQKVLDRLLFCAFSEDRGLLPPLTIQKAYQHGDPYNPRPIWDNFKGLFTAVDRGNAKLAIPRYNGGLFAPDPFLDGLTIPDDVCQKLHVLGDYDYRPAHEAANGAFLTDDDAAGHPLVDVDILGHIFEQSITDLERLRESLDKPADEAARAKNDRTSRRKREGAFYTPAFITTYIVEQALGGVLRERFEALRRRHEAEATKATKALLANPAAYDLQALKPAGRSALVRFWEDWQRELGTVRLLDPSCGSGAFLVEAFDQLYAWYEASNDRLADLRGDRTLFDLDRHILQHNLYGVDLNEEAVEICRLSLWIKTAERGKELTALERTILVGNSVVDDAGVDPRAFDWTTAFPEVTAAGGFDVVVGNPPYVRQELLSPIKPHLEAKFASYHGMADLYVYFYELGLRVLRPGGRLSLIVTNKWLKAGYAEPLRRHLAEQAWVESLVDFGHAKQIFEDADVFPCILVAQKPAPDREPPTPRVAVIPREQLRIDDLSRQIDEQGHSVEKARFGPSAWQVEPPGVSALLRKLREGGRPLRDVLGARPLFGIKTGFNDAYVVDAATRETIIRRDGGSAALLHPYMRGQDCERWQPEESGLWMLVLKSSENFAWPWAAAGDQAEAVFAKAYPGAYEHIKPFEDKLRKRQDHGRHWWELRSCAYWDTLVRPKIVYPDIAWRAQFAVDRSGKIVGNTIYLLPADDLWVLSVLNAPISWWFAWREAQHGKDEALRYMTPFMESFPIPLAGDDVRAETARLVGALQGIASNRASAVGAVLDWLRVEYDVAKPTMKLQAPHELELDEFAAEVKKVRGKGKAMTAASLVGLREEYARTLVPVRTASAEASGLERRLSDLVNAAYGLTPAEVTLMWETAPPRMPLTAPLAT